jgi:hypothetical protein
MTWGMECTHEDDEKGDAREKQVMGNVGMG